VTCAKGQNFDARGGMFSDRWMIGSCGGMGAAAGRLINGAIFPDSDDSMVRAARPKCGFILSLGNMAQWSAISFEGAMANVFQLHAGTT
jgi:hypothetical protein